MYNRFKNWVNESYAQLQMARSEWEFMSGRATVTLYPAILVYDASESLAGAEIEMQDSGFVATVVDEILLSGAFVDGDAKCLLYISGFSGDQPVIGEYVDITSPAPSTQVALFMGYGQYDFNIDGQVPDLYDVRLDTVLLQESTTSAGTRLLTYVDWDNWVKDYYSSTDRWGTPEYFTIDPSGDFLFYPRPDQNYILQFDYNKEAEQLSEYSDTPTLLPSAFHMALVWMAVEKAGMFDRDKAIVSRAQKELRFYRDRMEKAYIPQISFGRSTI